MRNRLTTTNLAAEDAGLQPGHIMTIAGNGKPKRVLITEVPTATTLTVTRGPRLWWALFRRWVGRKLRRLLDERKGGDRRQRKGTPDDRTGVGIFRDVSRARFRADRRQS